MTSSALPVSGRLIYAASETHPDLRYATGFQAPDPFLWFSTPAGAGIVVSALEFGRAQKAAPAGCEVLSIPQARQCWRIRNKDTGAGALIAGLARHTGIRTWEVPADFPLGLARTLARRRLRLIPCSAFFPERAVKTGREIDCVHEGVRLAECGLACALRILEQSTVGTDDGLRWRQQPLTVEILRGELDAEIARAGGTASHTIAAPGPQGADPHEVGHGPIRRGVPIVLDIFPRVDRTGYFGDLTRTVVKGAAPAIVRRAFAAVREAQQRAIAAIRPGVAGAEIHEIAADTLAQHGFKTDAKADPPTGFFHSTGHGVGLEIHELPRLGGAVKDLLEPGHVVTVEPGVYYPEWGGMRLEDVVVVTEQGCRNLTTVPKVLEIP
jgi:Xaa-Pro aminopeptidase